MNLPSSILVPIVQTAASLEVVSIAATLGKLRKSRVYVVHVIEVNRSLPLNAELDAEARRGEQLIRKAEEMANEVGYTVSGTLLQAREAGPALIDEARDREIGAIMMGVGYKKLTGSFQIGRTADFVMRNATCAVWVVRQSMAPVVHHHE